MSMGKQIFYHNLKNGGVPELKSWLEILKQRHKDLDKKIKEGYSNYLTDKNLNKMKFEKAALKREIAEVEEQLKAQQDEA